MSLTFDSEFSTPVLNPLLGSHTTDTLEALKERVGVDGALDGLQPLVLLPPEALLVLSLPKPEVRLVQVATLQPVYGLRESKSWPRLKDAPVRF